jgi:hypothetical protein
MTKEQEFASEFMKLVAKYRVSAISLSPFCYGSDNAISLCVGEKIVVDYLPIQDKWVTIID